MLPCMHCRVGRYAEAVVKSTSELETVITVIYANQRQMRRHDALHQYMDVITSYSGAVGTRGQVWSIWEWCGLKGECCCPAAPDRKVTSKEV